MKNVNDLKVGDKLRLGNRKLKLKRNKDKFDCSKCIFDKMNICCEDLVMFEIIPSCNGEYRKDKTYIYFEDVTEEE